MKARPQGLGPIVRVLLCGAMLLAVGYWVWLSGRIFMGFEGREWWPTIQVVIALAGQCSLLGAFLMADDGRRPLASRLAMSAALAFLLWVAVLAGADLWPIVDFQGGG